MQLNEQQQKAVKHTKGPALVLAGPGSGKTTVIIARLKYLVHEIGVKPSGILSMTFNKAAQIEMQKRCNHVFGENHGMRISTLHSFCNTVIKDYERRQRNTLKLIEGNDKETHNKHTLLKQIYHQINQSHISSEDLEELINHIGFMKNKMIKDVSADTFSIRNFMQIVNAYEQYKKQYLLIDFDDMLTFSYAILRKCPDILGYYRKKYPYIQVDEGQDLSKIQFEIIKILTVPQNNLFIVADDDQSIYGFRGAEPKHILQIQESFTGCTIYHLTHNYRSTKNIVDISSYLIKRNRYRFAKTHTTHHPDGSKPITFYTRDETSQTNEIIKNIRRLHKDNIYDIALLYRNQLSCISIVDALESAGIAYNIRQKNLHFFQHWVVQDIIAFMKFALNQCDQTSFLKICFKMNRYLSREMVSYALDQMKSDMNSIIDGLLLYPDLQIFQTRKIAGIKKEFHRLSKMSPCQVLSYIQNEFDYLNSVTGYHENRNISREYIERYYSVMQCIASKCATVPTFLERILELEKLFESKAKKISQSAVALSTIHSAKGLEYHTVMILDLNNEEFPGKCTANSVKAEDKVAWLEEERRLFYVGITRAKQYLYLYSPKTKNHQPMTPSMFLEEMNTYQNDLLLKEIGEGMLLTHKIFGTGVVSAIRTNTSGSTTLVMDFSGTKKELHFETCMEKGLLFI